MPDGTEGATRRFVSERVGTGPPKKETRRKIMNTNGRRSDLISWLNDAYAMERSLEVMLRKQAANEDAHHAIRERARIHLDETEIHVERVGQCLEMLGETPSTIKSVAGQVLEFAKGA